jgi:hypothetical protein
MKVDRGGTIAYDRTRHEQQLGPFLRVPDPDKTEPARGSKQPRGRCDLWGECLMTEAILKIKAEELTTIRLVFATKVVHEIPIDDLRDYAGQCQDEQTQRYLIALGQAVRFFASKRTDPAIEFVVPGQQPRVEPAQAATSFARH